MNAHDQRSVNDILDQIMVMTREHAALEDECQRVRAEAERLDRENSEMRNVLQAAAFALDDYAGDVPEARRIVDRIAGFGGLRLAAEVSDAG
jgi:predicted  nucleic acid-binding Zn-ribbon protein